MAKHLLTKSIVVRVTEPFARRFQAKARKQGKPAEVHREILAAFVDDRLTITPKVPKRRKK